MISTLRARALRDLKQRGVTEPYALLSLQTAGLADGEGRLTARGLVLEALEEDPIDHHQRHRHHFQRRAAAASEGCQWLANSNTGLVHRNKPARIAPGTLCGADPGHLVIYEPRSGEAPPARALCETCSRIASAKAEQGEKAEDQTPEPLAKIGEEVEVYGRSGVGIPQPRLHRGAYVRAVPGGHEIAMGSGIVKVTIAEEERH